MTQQPNKYAKGIEFMDKTLGQLFDDYLNTSPKIEGHLI